MTKTINFIAIVFALVLVLPIVSFAQTWEPPQANPPNDNASAPINVSADDQGKIGKLLVGGLFQAVTGVLVGSLTAGETALPTSPNPLLLRVKGNVGAAKYCDSLGTICKTVGEMGGGGFWSLTGNNLYPSTIGNNVGIGTATPSEQLEVRKPGTAVEAVASIFGGTGNSTTNKATLRLKTLGGGGGTAISDIYQTYKLSDYNLFIKPYGNTIFESGNVGIGTTAAPGAKLEVAGQIKITGGTPAANKILASDAVGLASWKTATELGLNGSGGLPSGTTGQTIRNQDGNWVASNNLFNNGANVGIGGNVTPSRKLSFKDEVGEKISLYTDSVAARGYYGFGVESNTLAYQVPATRNHSWYNGSNKVMNLSSGLLEVAGQVKISGGSPGVKKVLTSDNTGLATWKTFASAMTASEEKWFEADTDLGEWGLCVLNGMWGAWTVYESGCKVEKTVIPGSDKYQWTGRALRLHCYATCFN